MRIDDNDSIYDGIYIYNYKVLQRYWGVWLALLVAIVLKHSPRNEGQLLAPPEELVLRIEDVTNRITMWLMRRSLSLRRKPLYIKHIAGFASIYTPEEMIFVIQVKKLTWKKEQQSRVQLY